MAKRLMAEEEEDESSSMAESADHSVDEDGVMDDDAPPVPPVPRMNGVAH